MHIFNNNWSIGLSLAVALCLTNNLCVSGAPLEDHGSKEDINVFRAQSIKNAFRHAWSGYSTHAFGHDELEPLTNGTTDSRNGWGATIFDSLDTLIIMGLEDEYINAREHVRKVDWSATKDPSKTFETNIRYLGGLLSAYDLRQEPIFLEKALELTKLVILPAYGTPNRVPAAYVDVESGRPLKTKSLTLAEFGSMQLEFVRLSQITGDERYSTLANNVIHRMTNVHTDIPGLYPMSWDPSSFTPINKETQIDMWRTAVESMRSILRSETSDGMVFLSEFSNGYKYLQSGELICFMPGNLLLGGRYLDDPQMDTLAKELMDSCYNTWIRTPTGLSPESWSWIQKDQDNTQFPGSMQQMMKDDGFVANDKSYDLRPETLESLFYFYRMTGDPSYQDKAWTIFEAIEKYCKTSGGYTRVANVMDKENVDPLNFEESDPNLISLDEYVFNTEAHPFKLQNPIHVQADFS
ncbi:glycoside hydrolase [Phycomyces blakesleeanus]|uniref:alpha-1,2-Mannosidase n=1 Tax=Phycomyces blakesleeanus TaxID=4837 RepID=A0ABR3AMW6_PHYBL